MQLKMMIGSGVTRVLLVSNRFSPDYGGIETISLALADGLAKKGMTVEVLTHTKERSDVDSRISVTRSPGFSRTLRAFANADVVFHNNICLRFLWPALIVRRPLVFAVHNWLRRDDGHVGLREQLKRFVIGRFSSVTVSKAVQASMPFASTLVYNSYDREAFYSLGNEERVRYSVAFVGRLVRGKGCDVLLEALSLLSQRGLTFSCSVIGDGPERIRLEEMARAMKLQTVVFCGALQAQEIAVALRHTEVLAVPSHYGEAFGIVALEGVASGCFVVATDDGGLPEAVGSCGEVISQNDAVSLADAIADAWGKEPWKRPVYQEARAAHLEFFSGEAMIDGYYGVIAGAHS